MKKELQLKLYEKFPKIFAQRNKPMTETCMCWGIDTDDGWYDLISMLCDLLQWDIERNKYPEIEAVQVKEKYGTLRFYTAGVYKEEMRSTFKARMKGRIYHFLRLMMLKFCKELYQRDQHYYTQEGMIRFAEYLSGYICEKCGSNTNVTQTQGWIVTLCDKCMKERSLKNDETD